MSTALHERMKSAGIEFETSLRKEPEELPLDVVEAEATGGNKRARTTEANAGGERAARMAGRERGA